MSISNDPFADWDAAYVLGALSPSDRHAYEEHIEGCAQCAASLAELAAMPGMLARVPAEEAQQLTEPAQRRVATDSFPRLVHAVRRDRRHRRMWTAGATVALAACAALAALVVPAATGGHVPAGVSMSRVNPSTLSADVRLVSEPWGTRIESTCHYGNPPRGAPSTAGDGAYPTAEVEYGMYVTDRSGAEAQVSTWSARPGGTVTPTATTSLPVGQIESVDIRSIATGEVMLRSVFG